MADRRLDWSQVVRDKSDEEIKRTLDELIEAWEGCAKVQQERTDFDRNSSPPERPDWVIEGVEPLMEYNREKWRYEERRAELENRLREREEDFAYRSGLVRAILPEHSKLFYTYGGGEPDLQGISYEIRYQQRYDKSPRLKNTSYIVVQRRG